MEYEKVRQLVVEPPWWCRGSPLAWTTAEGQGLHHYAREGKVGLFNLGWWLLDWKSPPPFVVYQRTNILWAIITAPTVYIDGRTLIEHASFVTQAEFQNLMIRERQRGVGLRRFERHGVTWEHLLRLSVRPTEKENS